MDIILRGLARCPAGMKRILLLNAVREGKRKKARRLEHIGQQSECFTAEADASFLQYEFRAEKRWVSRNDK
jgi:hypothetical protein